MAAKETLLFVVGVIDVIVRVEVSWKQLLVSFELKRLRKFKIPRMIDSR